MLDFFHVTIYQPLYNILVFLYNVVPGKDFGVSIILLTIFLRIALIPIYKKQLESQKKIQELQPKIKELQEKVKDKEQQTRQMMELYKEHKTNPFSGCFPLVVQMVILITIYQVLLKISGNGGSLNIDASELYSFVANPGTINPYFLSVVDLTKPNMFIAVLAAIAQYFQTKMMMKNQPQPEKKNDNGKPDLTQMMSKQMMYLGPLMLLIFGFKLQAGLPLYWLAGTIFMIFQQLHLEKKSKN
ncbi:MAG TPA: YidC/Oxa1 family membrane protein insertase [Candidatus Moranbacteria bacterium]|nr:YidC/Oxa1 family membrane protein insertase [Candidatus Moranbacteria bacterium]